MSYYQFLTEYFTMLNKIIETNPTFYVVGFVKKSFNIETIPTIHDIPTFIKDPRVITAFNKKQIFVREMYGHMGGDGNDENEKSNKIIKRI